MIFIFRGSRKNDSGRPRKPRNGECGAGYGDCDEGLVGTSQNQLYRDRLPRGPVRRGRCSDLVSLARSIGAGLAAGTPGVLSVTASKA